MARIKLSVAHNAYDLLTVCNYIKNIIYLHVFLKGRWNYKAIESKDKFKGVTGPGVPAGGGVFFFFFDQGKKKMIPIVVFYYAFILISTTPLIVYNIPGDLW
jgi:hypothetical protein